MAEIRRLTKADILQGRNKVEYVYFEELGGEIPLRPLTDGQMTEIEAIQVRGITIKANSGNIRSVKDFDMNIDIEAITKAAHEADIKTVLYGIADGEAWTEEDIRNLTPPGIVGKIAAKIREISGIPEGGRDFLESFRKQQRRT